MINSIDLPKQALLIIESLENHGFQAYAVGGCVRDSLLGIPPKDWDICTSASPEQSMSALSKFRVIPTGIKFGTITVVVDDIPFEVTTYRKELGYVSHRKPKYVLFISSLKQDLARRDFTINAMAYHPTVGVVDYFGGVNHLTEGIICCVGKPQERFEEDALRILRAVRFCSTFGFRTTSETKKAMLEKRHLLSNISRERISSEFCKTICGKYTSAVLNEFKDIIVEILPELVPLINSNYKLQGNCNIWGSTVLSISNSESLLLLRLSLLTQYLGMPVLLNSGSLVQGYEEKSSELARQVACNLQIPKKDIDIIKRVVKYQNEDLPVNVKEVCLKLNNLGVNVYSLLLKMRLASSVTLSDEDKKTEINQVEKSQKLLNYIINNNICYSLEQLNIDGNDLLSLGYKQGPIIKNVLENILKQVVSGNIKNLRVELLRYANKLKAD